MTNIKAVLIEAETELVIVTNEFENTLENMQQFVQGYIEAVTLRYDNETDRAITAWMNEEGKLLDLKPSLAVVGRDFEVLDVIAGNVLITAVDSEGETVGLTQEEADYVIENIHTIYNMQEESIKAFRLER